MRPKLQHRKGVGQKIEKTDLGNTVLHAVAEPRGHLKGAVGLMTTKHQTNDKSVKNVWTADPVMDP